MKVKFELVYYDVAVQNISHTTTGTATVRVVENEVGKQSSNPRRGLLHFRKGWIHRLFVQLRVPSSANSGKETTLVEIKPLL